MSTKLTRYANQRRPQHQLLLAAVATLATFAGLSAPASAQNTETIGISLNDKFTATATDETLVGNIRDCRAGVGDAWTFTITFNEASYRSSLGALSSYALRIESASGACSSELGAADSDTCVTVRTTTTIPASLTTTYETTFEAFAGLAGPDECEGLTGTISLVVVSESYDGALDNNGVEDKDPVSDRFAVTFRNTRPGAPSGLSATAGEDNIRVAFTPPTDAPEDATYNLYIASDVDLVPGDAPEPFEESGVRRVTGTSASAVTVDSGLTTGVDYQLAVVTSDDDGNESVLSDVIVVTTSPTSDFYEVYRNSGGADPGGFGCSSTGSSPHGGWPILLLLGLVCGTVLLTGRRARLRERLSALLLAGALLTATAVTLTPSEAQAQVLFEKPQPPTGTFEVRFGNYTPNVDADFASPGPYELVFKNESMLLFEIEIERILWRAMGNFGVGFDFGFMQAVGKSLDASNASSVDTTVFNIIPLRLAAIYRFDYFANALRIPIVPVFKAGLDYYIWWMTTGDGDFAKSGGDEALGATLGYHVAIGLHLLLDIFNQRYANNLHYDFGIDNSYFFVEYMLATVDDFGDSSSINLSDDALMFGMAFDY